MSTATSPPRESRATRRRKDWSPALTHRQAILLLLPLLAMILFLVIYPLLRLVFESVSDGQGFDQYLLVLTSSSGQRALITTLVSAILVTVLAVPIGAILAWYIVTTRNPLVRAFAMLGALLSFCMGTVVKNYSIVMLLSSNGLVNSVLVMLGLEPVSLLYTPTAVVIGMTYTMIPYAVVSLAAVYGTVNGSLLTAARSMGATRGQAIRGVLLPMTLPGMVASSALIFSMSVGFYVTPVLLGGGQSPFMASIISESVNSYYNMPYAAAASVILLVVALGTLGIALRAVGRERLMRAIA